jgi:hypothetical protein
MTDIQGAVKMIVFTTLGYGAHPSAAPQKRFRRLQ